MDPCLTVRPPQRAYKTAPESAKLKKRKTASWYQHNCAGTSFFNCAGTSFSKKKKQHQQTKIQADTPLAGTSTIEKKITSQCISSDQQRQTKNKETFVLIQAKSSNQPKGGTIILEHFCSIHHPI
jgi:hypothetical protein